MARYYLRKEPYTHTTPSFTKTNGEVVPERVFEIERRALYKHHNLSRFYRDSYPAPQQKGLRLYTVKTMKTILAARQALREYCGEWFDVYDLDTGNRVDISKEATS